MFTAAVLLISLWRHFDLNPLSEWGLQGCLTWAACAGERSFSFLIFFFLLQTYHCWQAYKRPVIYVLGVLCFPSVKINVNTNNCICVWLFTLSSTPSAFCWYAFKRLFCNWMLFAWLRRKCLKCLSLFIFRLKCEEICT